MAVFEIVKPDWLLATGEASGAAERNFTGGLDTEIERLARSGVITPEAALAHALDPVALSQRLQSRAPRNR